MSTDANRAKACRMQRAGQSLREIGRAFDVSAPTVKRWCEQHRAALAAGEPGALAAEAAESAAPEDPVAPLEELPAVADVDDIPAAPAATPELVADAMATTRAMLRRTQELQAEAQRAGNHKLAQMHGRDAAGLVTLLARLEKTHKSDADTLHISRDEIARAFESVRDKAALICARPLLCAGCGRALSAKLAGIGIEAEGAGK